MTDRPLTPKQQRFVEEYLLDLNATQAATRAGYSAKTADVQGGQLIRNPSIATRVAAAQAKRAEKHEITLDSLTEMTLAAYRMAKDEVKDPKAAVSAVAQLSRMHGFDVGKRVNERSPIDELNADERDAVRQVVEDALERARADAGAKQDA